MIPAFHTVIGLADQFLRRSLLARVLWLTVLFILLAEVVLWIPSVARYHQDKLMGKLSAAQIAVITLDQISPDELRPELKRELLLNAGVRAIALRRNQTRQLYLAEPMPPNVGTTFETRDISMVTAIYQAFNTLFYAQGRTMRVVGTPRFSGGELIEIVADEETLAAELWAYSGRIALLSLFIAFITALPLFIILHWLLVQPMQRMTQAMISFQENPEDRTRIIKPVAGNHELALGEQALAQMQEQVRQALSQRAHLAALGLAVAKIQHDLRNVLTTAQLASDRLAQFDDPKVKQLAGRLMASIDRAIDLANNTLKYGRAEEAPPRRRSFSLQPLLDEVAEGALSVGKGRVAWTSKVEPGFTLNADPEQIFRILLNIGRNAVQALEGNGGGAVTVTAMRTAGVTVVDMSDDGPGIPPNISGGLFQPFAARGSDGGAGLGLAIARELARGHHGDLILLTTSDKGTVFRLTIPDSPQIT